MRSLSVSISLECSGAGFPGCSIPCPKGCSGSTVAGSPKDWASWERVLPIHLCQVHCPSFCPLWMPRNSNTAFVWGVGAKDMDTEVTGGSGKVRENIWREHLEVQLLCSCQPCAELISMFPNLCEKENMSSGLVQKQCRNNPCCQWQ